MGGWVGGWVGGGGAAGRCTTRGSCTCVTKDTEPEKLYLNSNSRGGLGVRAVHNSGILHGDFKTLNLLVGADQRVKVADFGLSKASARAVVVT